MRGFGATQVPVAYEQHMDILAEALGMSPYEIRMKNLFRKGSVTANGQVLTDSVPLETCLEILNQAMNGGSEAAGAANVEPSAEIPAGKEQEVVQHA
jgi:CO/xanthine dehydrogenase Mo-binding subunit